MFPLKWPESITILFNISNQVSNPGGEAAISVDCEMARWSSFSSPFYAKASTVALLPILAVSSCAAFWVSLRACRSRSRAPERHMSYQQTKERIVVSAVVIARARTSCELGVLASHIFARPHT